MTKQKITLTKIAQLSGVSITSVSRAIHTPHLISHHTQEKVNKAISILGFNPALFKPYIRNKSSKKILVIDNQLISGSLINRGIEAKAHELGYKLLYLRFFYFSEHEIQQIITYTINHKVDGILVINHAPYLTSLQQIQHALPPIVLVNQFSLSLPCVYFDHLSIVYQATLHLLEHGHRRIAILLGDIDNNEMDYYQQGYIQALTRGNITIKQDYISHQCFNYSLSHKAIKKLMQLALPPTAVICCDYINLNYTDRDKLIKDEKFDKSLSVESSICGVIDQCDAMNIHIPNDLSLLQFIHHKGHKQYQALNHLSAIYKPLWEMGERALSLLVSQLEIPYQERQSLLIDTELVPRHSVTKVGTID